MYLYATDHKFKHIYNVKTLNQYFEYAASNIKNAEEVIRKIQDYQKELIDHFQEVIDTPTKNIIKLSRSSDYKTNKKRFDVQCEVRPLLEEKRIDGSWITAEYLDHQRFEGRDRHRAIKYAEELSRKYGCEIERKGFNGN